MKKQRVSITIEVDLDQSEATMEDWVWYFDNHCRTYFSHYHPAVVAASFLAPDEPRKEGLKRHDHECQACGAQFSNLWVHSEFCMFCEREIQESMKT